MGYAFEKDNATEEYYLSSIEEVLEKNDSSFYEYGEYVIYKKYAKSSNFIVINGERKTKEVHVAIDPHNPKFGPVAYID